MYYIKGENMNINKGNKAFTLAELLIVIAIIGVVAMLVVPSLMVSYQKKVWVTQLKKSLHTWKDGILIMMTREGTSSFYKLGLGAIPSNYSENVYTVNTLKKYIKIAKWDVVENITGRNLDGSNFTHILTNWLKLTLEDGSIAYLKYSGNLEIANVYRYNDNSLILDINGDKKPNAWGRDMFWFVFQDNWEIVYPLDAGLITAKRPGPYANACISNTPTGIYCAHQLIEDGWEMKYWS